MTTIAIDVHDRICQDLHQQIRKLIVENEKLRAALEQPEQKAECDGGACGLGGYCDGCPNRPVAWQWLNTAIFRKKLPADAEPGAWNPLYTHPPRREWRSLSDEERQRVYDEAPAIEGVEYIPHGFARAVEAALKEKNHE